MVITPTKYDKQEYLSRIECADFLRAQGLRMSDRHLRNIAANNNQGNGPPFYRTRWNKVYYSRAQVIEWLRNEVTYVK